MACGMGCDGMGYYVVWYVRWTDTDDDVGGLEVTEGRDSRAAELRRQLLRLGNEGERTRG